MRCLLHSCDMAVYLGGQVARAESVVYVDRRHARAQLFNIASNAASPSKLAP